MKPAWMRLAHEVWPVVSDLVPADRRGWAKAIGRELGKDSPTIGRGDRHLIETAISEAVSLGLIDADRVEAITGKGVDRDEVR